MKKRPLHGDFLFGYHEPTRTESRLAAALRKVNVSFEQEAPVREYSVDFLVDGWLVVEVDGESHVVSENVVKDKKRQDILEGLGFTVLRVPSSEVSREEGAMRWAKRIRDIARKGPPGLSADKFTNNDIKEKVERVKEELRKKALLTGEKIRDQRARSALNHTGGRFPHQENQDEMTMEDYFGQRNEDFGTLLKQVGLGRIPDKDGELEEEPFTSGKMGKRRSRKK